MKTYPILGTLTPNSGTPIKMEIVKVTTAGFMVQSNVTQNWQTGDRFTVQFSLPTTDASLNEPVKLVKTYLKWLQPPPPPSAPMTAPEPGQAAAPDKNKLQIFEMHFLSLASQKKSVIEQFVARTEQQEKGGKSGS